MKTKKILVLLLVVLTVFSSCKKDSGDDNDSSLIPSTFKVDIPENLSNSKKKKSASADEIASGNDIYENLKTFIAVGEGAADMVQDIMRAIRIYKINRPMELTYTNGEDGRNKHLIVIENSSFEGTEYEFQLTISDVEFLGNADGGKGIQVFWNTNPIVGIAILKPYNIDYTENVNAPDALFRIDYSEAGTLGYDAHMFVSIAGLPLPQEPLANADLQYSIDNLKMFAGKKGDIVDVYGNSNHPIAKLFDQTYGNGFSWAFVASSKKTSADDIAVAEVGLPSTLLDSDDRTAILKDNSIINVFTKEIQIVLPWATSEMLAVYLANAQAPGFFDGNGFVKAGVAPNTTYNELTSRIEIMKPFSPKAVNDMVIDFK